MPDNIVWRDTASTRCTIVCLSHSFSPTVECYTHTRTQTIPGAHKLIEILVNAHLPQNVQETTNHKFSTDRIRCPNTTAETKYTPHSTNENSSYSRNSLCNHFLFSKAAKSSGQWRAQTNYVKRMVYGAENKRYLLDNKRIHNAHPYMLNNTLALYTHL